jgi:hypothetical protein
MYFRQPVPIPLCLFVSKWEDVPSKHWLVEEAIIDHDSEDSRITEVDGENVHH